MMTRKDYVAVSNILKDYQEVIDAYEYLDLCRDFAKYMARDNDRFDAIRFLEACGVRIPKEEYPQPKSALSHAALT
jgi:hypothetical protein